MERTKEHQPAAIESIRSPDAASRYLAAYDALLQKWPIPWESIQIPTAYGSTHVIACGPVDAPPLILLHGLQATALVWRANVAGLSRHFRVYAVDVIGQGGKSVSSRRLYKRRHMTEWMSEVLDALGIKQAAFVGNSYGGFLAMTMALLIPERVKQVVMINPGGVFVSVLPFMMGIVWDQLLQSLRLRPKQPRPDFSQMLGRNVRLRGMTPSGLHWYRWWLSTERCR